MRKDSREADAEASENGTELPLYIVLLLAILSACPSLNLIAVSCFSSDGVSTCLSYI